MRASRPTVEPRARALLVLATIDTLREGELEIQGRIVSAHAGFINVATDGSTYRINAQSGEVGRARGRGAPGGRGWSMEKIGSLRSMAVRRRPGSEK